MNSGSLDSRFSSVRLFTPLRCRGSVSILVAQAALVNVSVVGASMRTITPLMRCNGSMFILVAQATLVDMSVVRSSMRIFTPVARCRGAVIVLMTQPALVDVSVVSSSVASVRINYLLVVFRAQSVCDRVMVHSALGLVNAIGSSVDIVYKSSRALFVSAVAVRCAIGVQAKRK